jgi:hypothetical protein
MVKSDGPEEVRQGDGQGSSDLPEDLLRQVAVPIMESVEEGQEGGWLILPQGDELFVRRDSHLDLHGGEGASGFSLDRGLRE